MADKYVPINGQVYSTAVDGKAVSVSKVYDDGNNQFLNETLENLNNGKVDKETGKGLSTNDYTSVEKTKLAGIAANAEVNQNAFSTVKVGSTNIQADSKTDTLTLIAGSNVTLTPDATNDSITISASGGGGGGAGTLNTTNTTSQSTSSSESLGGSVQLHKVSKTGNYNDLLNRPTLPTLATVATTGNYNDLSNRPLIPDVSGKAEKSEMVVTQGTGSNADKTTIQLKSGTSATVLKTHQDISGKQNVISDLATIRSGAAAGATAQQPATTLAGYGITDAYTKVQGQALEDEIDSRLDSQDHAISLLNGNDVVVVADHTQVQNPSDHDIYREPEVVTAPDTPSYYIDWMYYDNAWVPIGKYSFPGIDNVPTDGSDLLVKSGGVANSINITNQKIMRIKASELYNGSIDSSGSIVSWGSSKYAVLIADGMNTIKVNKGENVQASILAILKSFTYNPSLPYTLDFATGITGRTVINSETSINLPYDTKYILVSMENNNGISSAPSMLEIDGVDYLKTIDERIDEAIDPTSKRIPFAFNNTGYALDYMGNAFAFATYDCTDFIPVNEYDEFLISGYSYYNPNDQSGQYPQVVGYSSNYSFVCVILEGNSNYLDMRISIPSGVSYIRCQGSNNSYYNTHECSSVDKKALSKGEVDAEIENVLADKAEGVVTVTKSTSTGFWVAYKDASGKNVRFYFAKSYKMWDSLNYIDSGGTTRVATNVVSTDLWDNTIVYIDDRYLIQGNTNFIYLANSNSVHVGGFHGCEVFTYSRFALDGVEIDFASMGNYTSITGKCFEFKWKSNVYASASSGGNTPDVNPCKLDTNGNPIIDSVHHIHGFIDRNGIRFDNRLTILKDTISFGQLHGAMLEMQYGRNGVLSEIMVNNAENTVNSISTDSPYDWSLVGDSTIILKGTTQNNCDEVEMVGSGVTVVQSSVPKDPSRYNNRRVMFVTYSDSDPRLKTYFMPYSDGEIFHTGDVFDVHVERKIICK